MPTRAALALSLVLATACGGSPPPPEYEPLIVEVREGRIYINRHIHFGHDSAEILPDSFELLDRVAQVIVDHPDIVGVQVQGHTSTVGEEAHNLELSSSRAAAVGEYLRSHGVTAEVTSQGYGETYPVCREETDECHEQNRRVEFFVDQR